MTIQTVRITDDNVNFFRLLLLLVEVGKKVLANLAVTRMPPNVSMDSFLSSYKTKLSDLKTKHKVLSLQQWNLLFPVAKQDEWDIALRCFLLTHICGVSPPANGWGSQPSGTDHSLGADLVRLRMFRNQICHSSDAEIRQSDFEILWENISKVLLRLSDSQSQPNFRTGIESDIASYKQACVPSSSTDKLITEIKQWKSMDEREDFDIIKSTLYELKADIAKLDSNCLSNLSRACDIILSKMEKLLGREDIDQEDSKWRRKIDKIMDEIQKMIICGQRMTDDKYTDVKRVLMDLGTKVDTFGKGYFDILFKQHDQILANQEQMHGLLECIMSCVGRERRASRVTHDQMVQTDNPTDQSRPEEDVVMSCGHRIADLDAYLKSLIRRGDTRLMCYHEGCEEWDIAELRQRLRWNFQENRFFESSLSKNYIAKNDIKSCPSCTSYCTRQEEKDVRVRCLICKNFEFCWDCMKEWVDDGRHVTCIGGDKAQQARRKYPTQIKRMTSILWGERQITSNVVRSLT